MHPITADDPAFNTVSRAGENLLIDKTTRRRYPAAPTGSLLLTSGPLGWSGIIVEQHRLPPAEMPEHSVIGHGISVNVGAQPTSFAWTIRRLPAAVHEGHTARDRRAHRPEQRQADRVR